MWPVFWYEFKHKRLGLAAYCGAILGFTVLYVMIYPSVLASMDKFQEIFKAYPKELFQAFNIPSLTFDTVEKYLGAESFSFVWPIMGIALVLARAGNGLAGEIERRTIGLLLSMPVSRGRIYLAKYLVGPVSILAFTLLSTVVVVPLAPLAGVQADAGIMLRALASTTLFLWAVFGLAMWLSAMLSERGKVYIIMSSGLVLMYVMNVVAQIQDKVSWLKYGSLFYYFDVQKLLAGGSWHWRPVAVFGAIIVVTFGLGLWSFGRRDVSV